MKINMRGRIVDIHRRPQWDLHPRKLIYPIVACHVRDGDVQKRLFVLWPCGFRGFGFHIEWHRY